MTVETVGGIIAAVSGGASAACVGMAVREGQRLIGEQLRRSFSENAQPPRADMADLLKQLI